MSILALGMPHGWEWIILLMIGLLLFGKRLPEVGRSLGRGIVEFKKGVKGVEEEIERETTTPAPPPRIEDSRTVSHQTATPRPATATPEQGAQP